MTDGGRAPADDLGRDWCPTAGTSRCENPAVMVLFGATGDLTRRKLMPAVYSLTADELLPCGLPIICVGRSARNREELCEQLKAHVEQYARRQPLDEVIWQRVLPHIQYVRGDLHDEATYRALKEVLDWADSTCECPMGRLFYLATPPEYFPTLFRSIKQHGLATDEAYGDRWTRLVVEKPFGRDAESARSLNALALELFSEDRIFRMDHYLGKETVQNIAVFRFANSVFEPVWNERHIDSVQITMAETVGLEGRGNFFDSVGMLRDVVQNHVLEMLCLVAMEPPVSMDADAIRDEKLKVLRSLRRMTPEEMEMGSVRGQYGPGRIDGEEVPGYLAEPHVADASATETYVALRLHVDNWRWGGVPFYIRAGKRWPRRVTEIVVNFKRAPHLVFGGERQGIERNRLVLRIQPDEGVRLSFSAKLPGPGLKIDQVPMDFHYARAFAHEPPEAYERLILDALVGDHTLFARGDAVEASWDCITPFVEHWAGRRERPIEYAAGSWGPEEANRLIAWTADRWHDPA